jgi:hypothetical protein
VGPAYWLEPGAFSTEIDFDRPIIGSFTATPNGSGVTLAVGDFSGSAAQGVSFYQDISGASGKGPGDASSATPLFLGTVGASSDWRLNVTGLDEPLDFYAVPKNDQGMIGFEWRDFTLSYPGYATLSPDSPPVISQFTCSSNTYMTGDVLTLDASGVSATDGTNLTVAFYSGNDFIGDGTFDGGAWTIDANMTGLTSAQTFYAVATDDQGLSSAVHTLTVNQRSMASIWELMAAPVAGGTAGTIALTADGIDDPNGTVQSVAFYQSANGALAGATPLGNGTLNADGSWSINANIGTAAETFFAVATDDSGLTSDAVAMSVNTTLDWDPTESGGLFQGGAGDWSADPLALDWFDPLTGMNEAWSNVGNNAASFGGSAGAVSVDAGIIAKSLSFSSSGYVLQDGSIALAAGGTISVDSGDAAIIESAVMGVSGLDKTGAGILELDATPVFPNDAVVEVAAGRLKFNVTSGTGSVGSNVTALVDSGATLELGGSVAALATASNRVNVVNNSQATGGGLVISGTNQQVGTIDGTSDVAASAGSDLVADRIRQNSLTIHGSTAAMGLVAIRGSATPYHHNNDDTSVLNSIAIANDGAAMGSRVYYGRLDVMNQDLIIQSSDEATAQAVYAAVTDMARSGLGTADDYSGSGVTSATASWDLNNGDGITAVGVILNDFGDEVNSDGSGTPIYGTFDGIAVNRYSTLVKYTFVGDTDLSGSVTGYDIGVVVSSFGTTGGGWASGDFAYQGTVNGFDVGSVEVAYYVQADYPGPL